MILSKYISYQIQYSLDLKMTQRLKITKNQVFSSKFSMRTLNKSIVKVKDNVLHVIKYALLIVCISALFLIMLCDVPNPYVGYFFGTVFISLASEAILEKKNK